MLSFSPILFVVFNLIITFSIIYLSDGDMPDKMKRLGLSSISVVEVMIAIILVVLMSRAENLAIELWGRVNPEQLAQVFQSQELKYTSLYARLITGILAGVFEEIQMRGYLQPRLGIIVTSAIFALLHIQYGFLSIGMLFVFFMSLILGLVRKTGSTTMSIIVHSGYNVAIALF